MRKFLCRVFGHSVVGEITGFRNSDRAAIYRCSMCGAPVVANEMFAHPGLVAEIEKGQAEPAGHALLIEDGHGGSGFFNEGTLEQAEAHRTGIQERAAKLPDAKFTFKIYELREVKE